MAAHNSCAGRRFYTVEKIAGGGLLIANVAPGALFFPGISRQGEIEGAILSQDTCPG